MDFPDLRSNFEPGTTRWAVRRAQWLAMGLSEQDLLKPKIAIVNSSSKLSVCYSHLDAVCRVVEGAIRAAGGVPFEIRTVAPSDFITSAGRQARYLMPSRDLLVNDIEVQVEGAELDGMVLLSSCDKTTPAHLMAAARLDIPAIVVPCGYQLGGECDGCRVDIEEVYKAVGLLKSGAITLDQLSAMTCTAITGPGVCAGLATANTMHVLAEALGMALPGSAPIRAGSDALNVSAERAGRAIVDLVAKGIRARAILTASAFRNAVRVAVATGCSVNCVRHLAAVAMEAELDIDIVREIEAVHDLPQLTLIRPNGPHRIEEFDAAGGCRGVMKRLRERFDTTALTVSGRALSVALDEAPEPDADRIRPLDQPFRDEPGLTILRGTLAPDGAVVKLSAVPADVRTFVGRARVFKNENAAIAALETRTIGPGDVVVLRGMGPKGGPGTVFAASFMAALVGAGLGAGVAVVTDGELSGLNSGITIGQIMPEAAEGGPLALVEEGDGIAIDLNSRTIDLQVANDVLARRRASWQPPDHSRVRGWLGQYASLVQPLSKGAVLRPPQTKT